VKSLVNTAGYWRVWTGLTDQVSEGSWRWVTGEPTSYTRWATGEPNNSGGAENYAFMNNSETWGDLPATWTAPHVCEFGSHAYRLVENNRSWQLASQDCEARGGYLATVGSSAENAILGQLLSARGLIHGWIGYTDEATEGTFRWTTWEQPAYSSWSYGEPNNGSGGNEDYAETSPSGYWNDLPTTWSVPALCEFGRPTWNPLVTLDLRPANRDDLAYSVSCKPSATGGATGCQPCPPSNIQRTLDANQQNASAAAQFLIIEKGQGVREPEARTGYNDLQLQLVNSANQVSNVTFSFGTKLSNPNVNYRPNGDVIVSLASTLAGGKRVKSIQYFENQSLSIACNLGPISTKTYYYSRIVLAN
jgi:hypothetical protein